jgi:hypothetical protein
MFLQIVLLGEAEFTWYVANYEYLVFHTIPGG